MAATMDWQFSFVRRGGGETWASRQWDALSFLFSIALGNIWGVWREAWQGERRAPLVESGVRPLAGCHRHPGRRQFALEKMCILTSSAVESMLSIWCSAGLARQGKHVTGI